MSIYRKDSFIIPDDLIYLDGNSLGPLSKASQSRIERTVNEQWGNDLILSWNKHDWFNLPETVGNKIANLLNAPSGSITISDSTSINLYKLIHAAIQINDNVKKKTILTDNLNFPTDLYIAQGILNSIHTDYHIKVVDTKAHQDPTQAIINAIDSSTAIVMLTHVGYDTGYAYDIQSINKKILEQGCLSIWDLSHSIGALYLDFNELDIDFAIGCTYKYLNGGPGAPAFLYVNPKHDGVHPAITGWMGSKDPFQFGLDYKKDNTIRKYRVGTPHILSLVSLDAALSLFENIDMKEVEESAQGLLDLFIESIKHHCPDMEVISPRDRTSRGTQAVIQPCDKDVSSYAIIQNLIARKVIGDFRQANSCRFGITPLYISATDIENTVQILSEILTTKSWNQQTYFKRETVT